MHAATKILVVDDEPNLRCTLSLIFARAGHSVTVAENIAEARRCLLKQSYDLVFLDLKMPDGDGMTILPEIISRYPLTPVLFLAAHTSMDSAVNAVRQGARDYLLKPIDPAQILARVDAILAEKKPCPNHPACSLDRSSTDPERFLKCGRFLLDLHAHHLTLGTQFIPLTQTNFEYLAVLIRHAPNPVSNQTLFNQAGGDLVSELEATKTIRWRIHELRKAVEPDPRQPRYIITVRGYGYRLAP